MIHQAAHSTQHGACDTQRAGGTQAAQGHDGQHTQPWGSAVLCVLVSQKAGRQRHGAVPMHSTVQLVWGAAVRRPQAACLSCTHVTVTTLTQTSCPRSTASLAELRRAELMLDT